ncbi:hypothetical protein BD779DRAFT_143004 [Infundibulicybe gibba]|nr:hypothetical protein BD779DRAFT_143004 [Infundibulicybe gibba]
MESPATYPLPIPRLRLSRFPQSSTHDNQATPQAQAGPSRLPEVGLNTNLHPYSDNDDEDDQPTPKMTASSIIPSLKNPGQAETPATRLRALLNRVPNSGGSSKTPMPQKPARSPPPPSEFDSDYEQEEDPPEGPSIARESLRDIFSRALREPGDTPQKRGAQPRRNSIDTSEVEASPRVAKERAKNKGKRRSLSDEEIENASKSGKSESSVRSSSQAASTFDSLRERLANSASQLKDEDLPSDYDRTTADGNLMTTTHSCEI